MASKQEAKTKPTVAKTDNGAIQITFTIPNSVISKKTLEVGAKLAKDVEVPGFRKGKAPLDKALEKIEPEKLTEQILSEILPKLFADAIREHKLKPAMYPKFELISAKPEEDWQVRATTAELPEINLKDYKKRIKNELSGTKIWTPGDDKDQKEPTNDEQEQKVAQYLVDSVDFKVPGVLIEEEVNARLSSLIERIDKLGLNLDSYLASVKKTPEKLREEYMTQANTSIKLDLILSKIAHEEGIQVSDDEFKSFLSAAEGDQQLGDTLSDPAQKRVLESVIKKRKALTLLAATI